MALLLYFLGGWSLFVLFILLQPQPNRSAHYYAILNEFLDVVAAQLFGHLHSDEFRAFGNSTFLLPILSLALSRSLSLSLSHCRAICVFVSVALALSLSCTPSRSPPTPTFVPYSFLRVLLSSDTNRYSYFRRTSVRF